MQLNFYQDPGHGWVRVSKKLIRELKIKTEISSSSYVKHPYVYLEEDGDLAVFLRAMEKIGKKLLLKNFILIIIPESGIIYRTLSGKFNYKTKEKNYGYKWNYWL